MNGYAVENPATPPETIPVRLGESYKSRLGIEQRGMDMPATPQSAKPPRAPGTDLEASNESSIPEAGINEIAATALSWENPLLSGILSIAGLLVAIAGDYLLRGKHGIPLLSAIAYGLLLDLAINFFRSVSSTKWQENSTWQNSQMLKRVNLNAEKLTHHLAAFHDRYLSARDPFLTLKVAALLWSLTYLGYALSIWRLVCLAYFAAFGIGALQVYCNTHLRNQVENAISSAKDQWRTMGLRRTQSAAVLSVILVVLVYFSSWMTRLLTVFQALIIIRCNLKPNEVDAIASKANSTCAPYMRSAQKQARRLSSAATDLVRRSNMGPASKPHRK